jgi:hypothetical protein
LIVHLANGNITDLYTLKSQYFAREDEKAFQLEVK